MSKNQQPLFFLLLSKCLSNYYDKMQYNVLCLNKNQDRKRRKIWDNYVLGIETGDLK